MNGKTPEKKFYRMYPDLDKIKIDTGVAPEYMNVEPLHIPSDEKTSGVKVNEQNR